MESQPDFIFNIAAPVTKPTSEELAVFGNPENLEPFLRELVRTGYITTEEAAAFIKFTIQLSNFIPFMLDGFLEQYRHSQRDKVDILKPPKKRIITPA